jgi:hypothetical protein
MTPVYEGGDPYRVDRGDPPKLVRDRLYDKMCDWAFHSLAEFDAWMPEREWVKAVVDLVHHGFAFDRKDGRLRLRRRAAGEPRQSVVELLSGVTLPDRIAAPAREAGGEAGEAGEDVGFAPGDDDAPKVDEAEAMVLDAEGKLVVSAADYVTDTCAILARKGMGKTYLAMLIAEFFLASEFEIPFVVVDPTGCWYGLAATAEGRPAENGVVVFGGEHGHRALAATSGRVLARMVVRLRLSAVFDLSLLPVEAQHGFVADFASELYLHNREAMHVFVDEADLFAPQKLDGGSKHQKRSLTALDNLTRRGRFRGIGDTLVSQRPAVVNKNLLSQVGTMFFMQMVAPQDLNAVDSWLHDNIRGDVKRECRAALPVLGRGVAYYMKSGDRSAFKRFKVRERATFDSSFTPRMGEEVVLPELAPISDEVARAVDEFLEADAAARATPAAGEADDDEGGDDD